MSLGIYLALLIFLFVGTLYRPVIGLASLLCIQVLDFWGQLSSPWLAENGKFTNLYVVGLIAIGLLRARQCSQNKIEGTPWVQILVICLWLEAGISLYWSPAPGQAIEEWGKHLPYMILHAVLAPLLVRRPLDLQYGLSALLILGTTLAALVVAFVRWDHRFIVSFYNPNEKFWNALAFAQMAGYITIAAALLNHQRNWYWGLVKGVAIASSVILVVQSGTRGQFLLMALLPIIFLPMSRPIGSLKTYMWGVLLVICLGSASIFAYDSFTQKDERWSSGRFQSDGEIRLMMTGRLLQQWLRSSDGDPAVFILGLGNSASFSQRIVGFYPHMMVPEILGEEGLLGLGLFGLAIWMSIRTMRIAYQLSKDNPVQRGILATLTACFTFAFLLSFKQGSLLSVSAELFLFAILIEKQTHLLAAPANDQIVKGPLKPISLNESSTLRYSV